MTLATSDSGSTLATVDPGSDQTVPATATIGIAMGGAGTDAAIETAAPTKTYPCADGRWLCIAGNSDLIFARLMTAIGRTDLAAEPRYATNGQRCAHRAELDAAIAAWTKTIAAKDAETLLDAAEVPCSRLFDIADCAADPHFLARKSVQTVQDPLIGQTLHPGPAIRLDGDRPEDVVAWTGPAVGAHTRYVLETLLAG